jgi:hypothetical protein
MNSSFSKLNQGKEVPSPTGSTLVVTHAELSARHGTGALLVRILHNEVNLMVFYSKEFFKSHDIEVSAVRISHPRLAFGSGRRRIRRLLKTRTVQRILCVPFYKDDAYSALVAQDYTHAPLALYLMDDQNIHVKEIPDGLMGALIDNAKICFAISPALCTAYQEKYGRKFWFVPPVADPEVFVPSGYKFSSNSPPRGILIGNLWSSYTLDRFRDTIRTAGLQVDWYGNAGKPFMTLDPKALAEDGIVLHSHVPEPTLIESARSADFAVIPAGTLDDSDSHQWLARASLPSRIIYLMAVANIPLIVIGHKETAAARFVTSLDLGAVCEYSGASFREAVNLVTENNSSARIRARAAELSPTFSSRGLSSWLWESMAAGQPINNQFQSLLQTQLSK